MQVETLSFPIQRVCSFKCPTTDERLHHLSTLGAVVPSDSTAFDPSAVVGDVPLAILDAPPDAPPSLYRLTTVAQSGVTCHTCLSKYLKKVQKDKGVHYALQSYSLQVDIESNLVAHIALLVDYGSDRTLRTC